MRQNLQKRRDCIGIVKISTSQHPKFQASITTLKIQAPKAPLQVLRCFELRRFVLSALTCQRFPFRIRLCRHLDMMTYPDLRSTVRNPSEPVAAGRAGRSIISF